MYVILLGAPGAGKGTQAQTLSQATGLAHVASGDIFRENLRQGTQLGLLAKGYMDRGELVPDEITIRMILERISAPDCAKGCLLDGFPRTLEQAQALNSALAKRGTTIDAVLYIKVSTEELLRRLSGRWICRSCQTPYHEVNSPPQVAGKCDQCGGELYQRSDDTQETARNRLDVYFAQTMPLIEHYVKASKLREVDGEQSIEAVSRDLMALLV